MSYDDVRFLAVDELRELFGRIDGAPLERLVALLAEAPRIFLLGAGRSGLVMRGFAMRLMHLGRSAHVVGEATTPALRSGDLLVIGSGSGATASLRAVCDRAKGLGAVIALVTTARQSPIGRLAELIVEIPATTPKGSPSSAVAGPSEEGPTSTPAGSPAPPRAFLGPSAQASAYAETAHEAEAPGAESPRAVGGVVSCQPMASLFEQALWLLLDTIILLLMERIHTSSEEMFSRHANLE